MQKGWAGLGMGSGSSNKTAAGEIVEGRGGRGRVRVVAGWELADVVFWPGSGSRELPIFFSLAGWKRWGKLGILALGQFGQLT